MRKNKQIIEYKDGTYTKSKIKWIDDCSYKVTRVKSTNAEDSRIKPNHVMQVNIVYVKNSEIIFYEILLNAKAYSGRMIKISD